VAACYWRQVDLIFTFRFATRLQCCRRPRTRNYGFAVSRDGFISP